MARRYFSAAPRVETRDTDYALVRVYPSSGAAVGEHAGPFVWLDITALPGRGSAFAHLTVEQARVIRDALSTFIAAESRDARPARRRPTAPTKPRRS